MIRPFSGEFLVSPIPLEMSMNLCSHQCSYCFANLNKPDRKLDVNGVITQIKNCHKNNSLSSYLLREKYPVLISNLVDPFAHVNWRQTLSFIELLNANGNKISFQTKGGQGIDEAMQLIDYPAHWYISISFVNEDLRKKIEPGAPSIKERFELIKKLKTNGHHVSIGINPLEEEWLNFDEFKELLERLKSLEVYDIWMEVLHLNAFQKKNLSERQKESLGVNIMELLKQRDANYSYHDFCKEYAVQNGFNVFGINQSIKSTYFDDYHNKYKTIKTHQDFINYCFEKYPNGGEIKFNEYYNFMKSEYYEIKFNECDGMVYRTGRNIYNRLEKKNFKTIKDVLITFWEEIEFEKSLFMNELFSILSYKENNRNFEYRCKEENMIIYFFNPLGGQNTRTFV